jgi:hypothetical protein
MPSDSPNLRRNLCVFLCGMAAALVFALYTDHVWEDYYITYRSSKNLATGHGLVFNHGDKLHTFTSPLGVLLPAASSLLAGNSSDQAALWIFRVMCAAAFGGAAALLFSLARRLGFAGPAALFPVAALLIDAKALDFTINGMETAFMLLFLACALRAHFSPGPRQWLHLGAAWAGLMWTRPDSFIYVGLIAAGVWLFNRPELTGGNRRQLIALFVRAGVLTTLLYGPWLLWAGWYYGTPVPHTITAKGGIGEGRSVMGLLLTIVQLPWLAWTKTSSLELTFLPSYYMIGGWPQGLILASRLLATLAALLWLAPRLHPWARAASFAFFGSHVYLTFFPYFPFPWYIPSTTFLALIALAGLFQIAGASRGLLGRMVLAAAAALLAAQLWVTVQVARQVRAQQDIVENGVRRGIGEWLRVHSSPGDSVFLEPLGYIGFFSGLKTFDWPGMSSREMVEARNQVGSSWGAIIQYLQPVWIVLRPWEIDRVDREAPGLLLNYYERAQTFDRSAEIAQLTIAGKPYVSHDAHFVVFRRRSVPLSDPAQVTLLQAGAKVVPKTMNLPPYAFVTDFNGHRVSVVGVPASFEIPVAEDLSELIGGFGLLDESWAGPRPAGPVEFVIQLLRADGTGQELLRRKIDPREKPDDRGFRPFRISLPQPSGGTLRFLTDQAGRAPQVRAFWSELEVIALRTALDANGVLVPATKESHGQFGFANTEEDGVPCTFAHAPATLVYPWTEGMNRLEAGFGILRGAYSGDKSTDGVVFVVELVSADGRHTELFRRHLDPSRASPDRGPQSLSVALPSLPGGRIVLRVEAPASGRYNFAWSYWRNIRTRP